MTDVFIAEVRRALRQSLFQKLKGYGLSQDDVTAVVASATSKAMAVADIPALATAAGLAAPVADALRTAVPNSPALATYDTARAALPGRIRQLSVRQDEV